jgi:hypothetical protein
MAGTIYFEPVLSYSEVLFSSLILGLPELFMWKQKLLIDQNTVFMKWLKSSYTLLSSIYAQTYHEFYSQKAKQQL